MRVKALALVDVGPEIQPEGTARIRKELLDAPEEFESLDAAVAQACAENPLASESVLRRRVQYQTRSLANGRVGWRYDPVIRDQMRSNTRPTPPDFWALWRAVQCPAVILRGAQTDTLSSSVVQRMLESQPRARLMEIPRAGHMVFEDNPRDFSLALREWLATLKR
jgi:pimeloyl-ACP methyl ester carboxylesterase